MAWGGGTGFKQKQLFSGPEDVNHIMLMLRRREVYRHLSNAADRGDEAADLIGRIVMQMT